MLHPYDRDVGCLYRGPHGRKCAVGHLVTDEEWENLPANSIKLPERLQPHVLLLRQMQIAHDNAVDAPDFIQSFKQRMKIVASNFGLEVPND